MGRTSNFRFWVRILKPFYWKIGMLGFMPSLPNPIFHYCTIPSLHFLFPRPRFQRLHADLQQCRPRMRQRAVQSRLQITRLLDALAIGAERPRHRCVIASQRDADLVSFETLVKRLPAGTETFVVQNYRQGPDVVASRRLDLHAGQTEGAISRDIDDGLIGMGQFRAHGRGRGPAHGAVPAETDKAVGKQRLVMVRDIGASYAGVMQENRVVAIEAVGQVPTGTVRIYWDFVRSEPLVPGIHPLLFELADFFGHYPIHPLAPSIKFLRSSLKQRLQKEF